MIEIEKSKKADSRSADGKVSVEELKVDTKKHTNDIRSAMAFMAAELMKRAHIHDHTKLDNIEEFCAALNSGHIKDTPWYQKHITQERHHLKSNVPDDVNLIDVLEHIIDCTMAGLARSGEIYDVDISPEVLVLACKNTVELLKENTKVVINGKDIGSN